MTPVSPEANQHNVEQEAANAYILAKAAELRTAADTNPDEFKRLFNANRDKALAAQRIAQTGEHPKGAVQIETTTTHKVVMTHVTSQGAIEAFTRNVNNLLDAALPANLPSNTRNRELITQLVRKIDNPNADLDAENAPFVYKILDNILNNAVTDPFTVLNDADFKYFAKVDTSMHKKVTDAIVAASTGVKNQNEIDDFKRQREAERPDRADQNKKVDRGDYDEQQLQEVFGGNDLDSKNAKEFYDATETSEKFVQLYRTKLQETLNKITRDRNHPQQSIDSLPPDDPLMEEAARKVADEFHDTILFMIYKLFGPILDRDPTSDFKTLAQETGSGFSNLLTQSNKIFRRLSNLKRDASAKHVHGLPFMVLGNEKQETYDELEGFRQDTVVSTRLQPTHDYHHFTDNLVAAFESERDNLEYAVNGNLVVQRGPGSRGESVFAQLRGFAEHAFPAGRLDELYKHKHGELIEAAKIDLSNAYKKQFAKARWIRDPQVLAEIFSHHNTVENKTRELLAKNFPGWPDWVLDRAIIQARMHFMLIDFGLHGLAGYSRPALTPKGGETYKDPPFKHLDVYDAWVAAEQWRVSDTELKSVAWMPDGDTPNQKWFHQEISTEGKEVYEDAFDIGDLSREGKDYFNHEVKPNIMEGNVMGVGGIEVLSGWRIKWAYMPWIEENTHHFPKEVLGYDKNNKEIKRKIRQSELIMDGHPDAIVENWKRVENLGISVTKNFANEFLFGDDNRFLKIGNDGKIKYEQHYEKFYKFLYRRYFSEGVGESLYPTDKGYNENKFWDEVKGIIYQKEQALDADELTLEGKSAVEKRGLKKRRKALQDIVQNALGVMTFERNPLDIVYMENPTRSQNGVTFMDEIYGNFVKVGPKENKTENIKQRDAVDEALDDLSFVQENARIETARMMAKAIEEEEYRKDKNLFGKNLKDSSDGHDRSDIISLGENKQGYVIDEEYVRKVLEKKYFIQPEDSDEVKTDKAANQQEYQHKFDLSMNVYKYIDERVIELPKENRVETRDRELIGTEHPDAKEAHKPIYVNEDGSRKSWLVNRLQWSTGELFSGQTGLAVNGDTAYQFLEFSRAGKDMIARSAGYMATTVEPYRAFLDPTQKEQFLDGAKEVARKGETSVLVSAISNLKTAIKQEDEGVATMMTRKNVERAVKILRRNSDAEDAMGVLNYKLLHKKTSAAGAFVDEGPVYDLDRQGRYRLVSDFAQKAILPKYDKIENREGIKVDSREEAFRMKYGSGFTWIGKAQDKVMSTLGREDYNVILRNKATETSSEGVRVQNAASRDEVLFYHGVPILGLVGIGMLFFAVKAGSEEMHTT